MQAHSYKIINNVYQLMRSGAPHSFSGVGQKMYYVYILKSEKDNSRYIGATADLKKRLQEHNSGRSKYSNTKRPYQIIWYSAFSEKQRAYDFEKYLKSSSGYAFTKKRLA